LRLQRTRHLTDQRAPQRAERLKTGIGSAETVGLRCAALARRALPAIPCCTSWRLASAFGAHTSCSGRIAPQRIAVRPVRACCSMLHCAVLRCNVSCCVATCRAALQRVAPRCNVLRRVATCCAALPRIVLRCDVLWRVHADARAPARCASRRSRPPAARQRRLCPAARRARICSRPPSAESREATWCTLFGNLLDSVATWSISLRRGGLPCNVFYVAQAAACSMEARVCTRAWLHDLRALCGRPKARPRVWQMARARNKGAQGSGWRCSHEPARLDRSTWT
jgi:hypothetical protein